ncbi:MAG: alpha/beta hydrolase [Candidatus Rariloculaceae bacterium]
MTDTLEALEISTGDFPVASVIWLHGLGADGNDFAPLVPELDLPVATRFVFPHALIRPVTVNMGVRMRAWYDIYSLDRTDVVDEAGIEASTEAVTELIDREIQRGVASENIIVAGFSQGGAIGLQAALRYPQPLGGVLALSTYLTLAAKLEANKSPGNASIPLFVAHGTQDPVVPPAMGLAAKDRLVEFGYAVEWHSYEMAHSVCAEEVADINAWLISRLS